MGAWISGKMPEEHEWPRLVDLEVPTIPIPVRAPATKKAMDQCLCAS